MNEWMNEWVGGWVGGWVGEWVSEWVSEWASNSNSNSVSLLRLTLQRVSVSNWSSYNKGFEFNKHNKLTKTTRLQNRMIYAYYFRSVFLV